MILKQNVPGKISQKKRTYIIFGMPRGGTTMTAGVCSLLGLDIGTDLPVNLEDPNFNLEILDGTLDEKVVHIRSEIKKRNAMQDVWGWKYPSAALYLPRILDDVVNPHLIVVYRDFVAQGSRAHRSGKESLDSLLAQYIRRLNHVRNAVAEFNCPTIMLSYEKCVRKPNKFMNGLADFLGTDRPDDQTRATIREFMRPDSYKDIRDFRVELSRTL